MSRTIYASSTGTGDGLSDASPTTLARAVNLCGDGGTVLLVGGGVHGGAQFPKGINGVTVASQGKRATIDAPTGLLFLLAGAGLELRDIDFTDSTRDPARAGFSPHPGGFGLAFRQCDKAQVTVHGCTFRWFAECIDLAATNQSGSLVEGNYFGPSYGIAQRSQGIFLSGQFGAVVRANFFDHSGWWPGIAPANNQCHGIYGHWAPDAPAGPLQVEKNVFINCAAAGPTSNSGGTFDRNIIIDCAQDGSGTGAWISRDVGVFTNNTLVGCWYNAISQWATVTGNVLINPGPIAINVDVPAGAQGWRKPTDIVDVSGNLAFGFTGPVVRRANLGGGSVNDVNNLAFPANAAIEQAFRRAFSTPFPVGVNLKTA